MQYILVGAREPSGKDYTVNSTAAAAAAAAAELNKIR